MLERGLWKSWQAAQSIARLEAKAADAVNTCGQQGRLSAYYGDGFADAIATLKGPEEDDRFFPGIQDQFRRLYQLFCDDGTCGEFQWGARALKERWEDDIRRHYLYWVLPDHVEYYQNLELFGPKVPVKFPAAIDDIEGAGKCIALGQGTAAVLHLMRVMECGLKALAASPPLGIPYAPSWESYLRQISNKMAEDHKKKTEDWKRHEPFFRDVSGDLVAIKLAWRNPTMHVGRKYDVSEAEDIFKAVRSFMQRLALGIPA